MNKRMLFIYMLIMLEARLSLEDASKLFGIPKEELEERILARKDYPYFYIDALKYLVYRESLLPSYNRAKSLFMGKLLLKRLHKILHIPDSQMRKEELDKFVKVLSGPDLKHVLYRKIGPYSEEDKKLILSYRLKYAVSNKEMYAIFKIRHDRLEKWENELEESKLKTQLINLRDYLNSCYFEERRRL